MAQGRVGVGQQHLRRVAAAVRDGRLPVPDEVEREDRTRPVREMRRQRLGRAFGETVEEQERRSRSSSQLVQRQLGARVTQPNHRCAGLAGRRGTIRCRRPRPDLAPSKASGGRADEVEDQVGHPARMLDVHEVAAVLQRHERAARGQEMGNVFGLRAPTHRLADESEHAEHGHRQTRHPHHRPLRAPRAEPTEAHDRIELPSPLSGSVLASPDRHEVPQPIEGEARVHPLPARRELVDRSGLALLRRRRSAMVEPRAQLSRQQARALVVGHVGPTPSRRKAIEVHEVGTPMRHRFGQLHQNAAALGVTHERNR